MTLKLRTDPARVRLVLAFYDLHGLRPTMRQFDLESRSILRWLAAREEHGPDWPTPDMDLEWAATSARRARRAAAQRHWRTRSYINRGPLKVDPTGTIRRVRALQAIGWSAAQIAAHGHWETADSLNDISTRERIHVDTRDTIARIYDRLCMTPGPSQTTRRRALAKGWAPPLAWDDIDNDAEPATGGISGDIDPVVVERLLAGRHVPSTRAEKTEAVRRWVNSGRPEKSLCEIHGWNRGRYSPRAPEGISA